MDSAAVQMRRHEPGSLLCPVQHGTVSSCPSYLRQTKYRRLCSLSAPLLPRWSGKNHIFKSSPSWISCWSRTLFGPIQNHHTMLKFVLCLFATFCALQVLSTPIPALPGSWVRRPYFQHGSETLKRAMQRSQASIPYSSPREGRTDGSHCREGQART